MPNKDGLPLYADLRRHGMRIGRIDAATGPGRYRYVLFREGVHNGEAVEWQQEFPTRLEARRRAAEIIAAKSETR